jgi:hypothetical protein
MHQATKRRIPGAHDFNNHCRENVKSLTLGYHGASQRSQHASLRFISNNNNNLSFLAPRYINLAAEKND